MAKASDPSKANAATQAALQSIKGQEETIKQGANATLAQVVPILQVHFQPTTVDPGDPSGVGNMKRVLSAILNDEENRITVKDEVGKAVGVANFNQIYTQVIGPDDDGCIEIEYHEQATLGFLGDVMWSLNWFVANGFLGIPKRVTRAVLQAVGVSFVLETYYKSWLVTILDQFNQRGLIPGYVNAKTGENNWEVFTRKVGRNIIVRPVERFVYSDTKAALKTKKK
jgi:hypothetical protein